MLCTLRARTFAGVSESSVLALSAAGAVLAVEYEEFVSAQSAVSAEPLVPVKVTPTIVTSVVYLRLIINIV